MPIDWGDVASRLIPLLIGIGGLLLAAYQARLSGQDRAEERKVRVAEATAAYRQHLFERQLDAYIELASAATSLLADAMARLTAELHSTKGAEPMSPERRFQLRGELMGTWAPLIVLRQRNAIIYSNAVSGALGGFEKALLDITSPPGLKNEPELASHPDPSGPFAERYTTLIAAIRDAIGVEPLTAATLRAIARASGETVDSP